MRRISPSRRRTDPRWPALCPVVCIALMAGCGASVRSGLAGSPAAPAASGGMAGKANQIISSALSDPDPRIRSSAIEVAASTQGLRFAPSVRRLIRDPVVPVRFAAILAIGDLHYTVARADVQQIADETKEDANVRLAAAYALCRLGSARYADYLRKAISSPNQTVRANAALVLGKAGDTQALDVLRWAMQDKDSDEQVLIQAAESIAMLGDGRIYQRLWGKLISAYADDRIAGIRAMGALGTEQARNAILTMLNDGVVEVRLTAAGQLGRLHDTTGQVKVLEALAKDLPTASPAEETGEPSRVKVLAALAIGEIRTEPLVKCLPRLLDDRSVFVQVAAAKAVLMQTGKATR